MKNVVLGFCHRGLMAAVGGPIIMAIVFLCLGAGGVVETLTVGEVCRGIFSTSLMAFIAAGISIVYSIERLPLPMAGLIQGGVLYLDYLLMYLLNGWMPRNPTVIGIFTIIFLVVYMLIWVIVYFSIKSSADAVSRKLGEN